LVLFYWPHNNNFSFSFVHNMFQLHAVITTKLLKHI
jgi:hypothetical protein